MDSFQIRLLNQHWINDLPDDGLDMCSHGAVLLKINDLVLSNENNSDWTVASAALRLMKSALFKYDSGTDFEVIPHCGYLRAFPSCSNYYITWDTDINDNIITMTNLQAAGIFHDEYQPANVGSEMEQRECSVKPLSLPARLKALFASLLHASRNIGDICDQPMIMETSTPKHIGDSFEIERKSYAAQALRFADEVKTFYSFSLPRKFSDEYEQQDFALFWKEFDEYYGILKDTIY